MPIKPKTTRKKVAPYVPTISEYDKGYEHAAKAFGGCLKCYGKGYSTQIKGERLYLNTCVCSRGRDFNNISYLIQKGEAVIVN